MLFCRLFGKIDEIVPTKEVASGTTLVGDDKKSYIQRMLSLGQSTKVDGFVCQLSTNDATKNKTLGEISEGYELQDFDAQTITGAMEYIICNAKQIWNLLFFTRILTMKMIIIKLW